MRELASCCSYFSFPLDGESTITCQTSDSISNRLLFPLASTMSRKVRVALIGGGMITESAHLPAAMACSDVTVAALVDPVLDRIGALARRHGIAPRLAADVSEVIGDVDAAVIATPNDTHAAIAAKCIDAGIPVLIEKPLASNASEGRAILDLASKRDVLVAPGYVTRFRPNLRLLKSLLDRRYFGRVRRFVHQFGTPGGWAPMSGYNLKRSSAGGGVLMVTGTHFLDRMLWFWGMPSSVAYFDDSHGGPEANCAARFKFDAATDLEGEVRYSKTMALPGCLVIDAERGWVRLADTEDADIEFRPHDSPDLVHSLRDDAVSGVAESGFDLQMRAFAEACRKESVFPVPAQQAVDSLELIERLYSCRQPLVDDWHGGK